MLYESKRLKTEEDRKKLLDVRKHGEIPGMMWEILGR